MRIRWRDQASIEERKGKERLAAKENAREDKKIPVLGQADRRARATLSGARQRGGPCHLDLPVSPQAQHTTVTQGRPDLGLSAWRLSCFLIEDGPLGPCRSLRWIHWLP